MLSASGGEIEITGKTESAPYIDMTVNALRSFNCPIEKTENGYRVTKTYPLGSPEKITAKGDWSNAAFFITAGVVGKKPVTVTGLEPNSAQGDKAEIPQDELRDYLGENNLDIFGNDIKYYKYEDGNYLIQIEEAQFPVYNLRFITSKGSYFECELSH